ncbi:hypothetical protein CLAIMM_01015 [Cladophialophora immunda]|nr:hypothetical protein CLAIMM_01015 [Cladophialophora immunda]
MSEIKSVAIAGANGVVGPHVLKALTEAGFQVTILTRSKKSDAQDSNVKVVEVDYTSVQSLTAALTDIDAVVSTVGHEAIAAQQTLIDAAIAAGVKRFIPSEYSSCSYNPKIENLPTYTPMTRIRQYLDEQAKAGKLTWTVLATGAFLEFLFDRPTLLDYANHKATLYDKGDNRVSSTSLPQVGKAVVGVLKNLEATKNKIVKVSEVILTQNQLLGIAKALKPEIKWETHEVPCSVLVQQGLDDFKAGNTGMPAAMKVLAGTALAGDVYGCAFDENDNKLLGVKEMTEENLKKLVASKL